MRRSHMGFDLKLPNSGQLIDALVGGGTKGAEQLISASIVNSPDVQAAAKTYAEQTAAQKLAKYFIENKKTITIVGIGAGILLAGWFFSKKR